VTPQTLSETSSAEPAAAKPRDRRGGLSFAVVGGVFALLLFLGIGLGVIIHRSYVGFERVAARHVPPDASFVLRWDVEKVSLFEPTRRFLLPLLDATPNGGTPTTATRRERFADESGAVLGRQLREVLVTFGPGAGDWTVLVAGSFPRADLIAAAERTLAAESSAWRSAGPERLAGPGGVALGRAPDGVVALASSSVRLDAALATHPLQAEVPRLGAGAFVFEPGPGTPEGVVAVLAPLGPVTRVVAEARWGTPLPLTVTLDFPDTPPADVAARVRRSLELLLGDDLPRIERELAPISVKPAGKRASRVEFVVDDAALEHAGKRAAEAVERVLGVGPAQK
jgi:hypothetical protein